MTDISADDDAKYMRSALALASKGRGRTAPNPMVGALVVRGGTIVGRGHHAAFGGEHAERIALREAGDRARGATLYVTLEPCTHTGKQPPCVEAVLASGIVRVVLAVRDPNPAAGGGVERLRAAGIEVMVGPEEAAVRELNAPFFHSFASDRPWVTLKLAVSVDGAIADAVGSPGWLTGERARRAVHRLRAGHDAVAIGVGTAIADDPLLTVRHGPAPRVMPVRVVFDRTLRLPPDSRLVRTAAEAPLVVVAERPDAQRRAVLTRAGVTVVDAVDAPDALRLLRARGILSLLTEGGAGLAGSLIAADVVDRLIIIQAPRLLGGGALGAFSRVPGFSLRSAPRLRVLGRRELGPDVMTTYAVH